MSCLRIMVLKLQYQPMKVTYWRPLTDIRVSIEERKFGLDIISFTQTIWMFDNIHNCLLRNIISYCNQQKIDFNSFR